MINWIIKQITNWIETRRRGKTIKGNPTQLCEQWKINWKKDKLKKINWIIKQIFHKLIIKLNRARPTWQNHQRKPHSVTWTMLMTPNLASFPLLVFYTNGPYWGISPTLWLPVSKCLAQLPIKTPLKQYVFVLLISSYNVLLPWKIEK